MNLEEILQKLQLGIKYRQNCELGFADSNTLLKHIEDLKSAISTQNSALIELKQAASNVVAVLAPAKKKGKK